MREPTDNLCRWRRTPRTKPRRYRDQHHLHAYENQIILRCYAEREGAPMSAKEFCIYWPVRFNEVRLRTALKRMHSERTLKRDRGFSRFSRGYVYSLTDVVAQAMKVGQTAGRDQAA